MNPEITQAEFDTIFVTNDETAICPCDQENPPVFHQQSITNIRASNSKLGCTRFVNCGFSNCDFEGAILARSSFKLSNLKNVSFNNACLMDGDLRGVRMRACSFVKATITGANFGPAPIANSVDVAADLEESDFSHSDMERVTLKSANLKHANLFECNLKGADLAGASLCQANLSGADLSKADLRGADLTGADLRNTKLDGARLEGAVLDDAKIFLGRSLLDGHTRGVLDAHMLWVMSAGKRGKRADLQSAKLFKKDLSYAELSCADLRDADLSHADLRGAYLTGADLMGADLREADITGADLRGANLANALVSEEQLLHAITDNFIVIASSSRKIAATKLSLPSNKSHSLLHAC